MTSTDIPIVLSCDISVDSVDLFKDGRFIVDHQHRS